MLLNIIIVLLLIHQGWPKLKLPTPEKLVENTFLMDTAQAPDEQSQNENEDLTEGDIMPAEIWKRRKRRRKRGLAEENRLDRNAVTGLQWDYHIIPYRINYDTLGKKIGYKRWVQLKMDYVLNFEYSYKLGDCITFCEYNSCKKLNRKWNKRNYIEIRFDQGGCWSGVGMSGGRQVVNVQFHSCMKKGTIAHEIMHALGFYHEHSRPDRKKYVWVMHANVRRDRQNNYNVQPSTRAYDHYDFSSVMHYGEFAFRNKMWGDLSAQFTRTIYPTPWSLSSVFMQLKNYGRGVTMGQRIGLSFCDELKIRRLYSEPGIRGGGKCSLWTERTCRCLSYSGTKPDGWDADQCSKFNLSRDLAEFSELQADQGSTSGSTWDLPSCHLLVFVNFLFAAIRYC